MARTTFNTKTGMEWFIEDYTDPKSGERRYRYGFVMEHDLDHVVGRGYKSRPSVKKLQQRYANKEQKFSVGRYDILQPLFGGEFKTAIYSEFHAEGDYIVAPVKDINGIAYEFEKGGKFYFRCEDKELLTAYTR